MNTQKDLRKKATQEEQLELNQMFWNQRFITLFLIAALTTCFFGYVLWF